MPGLERYEVGETVGRGDAGTVQHARDTEAESDVTLRVLALPAEAEEERAERAQRFEAEARALETIDHPGVVRVLDSFVEGDSAYLVTERVAGHSLDDLLGAGPLGYAAALGVTTQMLDAITAAAAQRVVHRRLTPADVVLLDDGAVRVDGFGDAATIVGTQPALTSSDQTADTYQAPEVARGELADECASVFSVGVMLYRMLVGGNPFDAPTPAAVLYRIAYEEPPSPALFVADLPPYVEAVLTKALAKDPALRYASAAEMATDIADEVAPDVSAIEVAAAARLASAADPPKLPKVRKPFPVKLVAMIAGALVVVLALGGGGYAIYRNRLAQDAERMAAIRAEGAVMVDQVAELKAIERDFTQLVASIDAKAAANQEQLTAWDGEWQTRVSRYETRSAEVQRHNQAEEQRRQSSAYSMWDYWSWSYITYYPYEPNLWEYPSYPNSPAPVSADFTTEGATLSALVTRAAALKESLNADALSARYFGVVYARMIEAVDVLLARLNDTGVAMGDMVQTNPEKGDILNRSKIGLIDGKSVTDAIAIVDQEVSLYASNLGVSIDELLAYEPKAAAASAEATSTGEAAGDVTDGAASAAEPATGQ